MKNIAVKLLMIATVVAVNACSSNKDKGFPSLVGNSSQESIRYTKSNKSYVDLAKVSNTGTFVGQKTAAFRNELSNIQNANQAHSEELQKIRNNIIENTAQYENNVNAIEQRLQIGTTTGNPHLYDAWAKANDNLQAVSQQSTALENLNAKIISNATSARFLIENIQASYNISGAVDEDHAQLRTLQNEATQVSNLINQVSSEATSDVASHRQFMLNGRAKLSSLSTGIKNGNLQGTPSIAVEREPLFTGKPTPVAEKPSNVARPAAAVRGKPIFSVRFNSDNVDYSAGLNASVEAALERKPHTIFDVVAVSSSGNQSKAQGYANKVFQDVVAIGVNPNNVNLGARNEANASTPEVHVYAK